MTAWDVRPGEGIGPLSIGMIRSDAHAALTAAGLEPAEFSKVPTAPPALTAGGSLFAYFDASDRVAEVEAAVEAEGSGDLVWGEVDLTGPAAQLAAELDARGEPDRSDREFPGTRAYPELGLVLWTDSKPDAWMEGPFETVLVRRPSRT